MNNTLTSLLALIIVLIEVLVIESLIPVGLAKLEIRRR
jgi:hypothetical protein